MADLKVKIRAASSANKHSANSNDKDLLVYSPTREYLVKHFNPHCITAL